MVLIHGPDRSPISRWTSEDSADVSCDEFGSTGASFASAAFQTLVGEKRRVFAGNGVTTSSAPIADGPLGGVGSEDWVELVGWVESVDCEVPVGCELVGAGAVCWAARVGCRTGFAWCAWWCLRALCFRAWCRLC